MQQVSALMLVVVAAIGISLFPRLALLTDWNKMSRSSNLAFAKLNRWSDQNQPSVLLRALSLPKLQYSACYALQFHLVHYASLVEKR